jgi:L-2-hydroxycarboxylate dehydrogenase (NAD+)
MQMPLRDFCAAVFEKLDVSADDAWVTADVLVAADLRGIASHGVARLRRYVAGLRDGVMIARPQVRVLTETPATAALDARRRPGPAHQPARHAAGHRQSAQCRRRRCHRP